MLAASLDAIVAIDERGRLTEFNPAAERMFGYARDEVLERPMSEVLLPDRVREGHELARFPEPPTSQILGRRLRLPATRRDGSEFTTELVVIRVPESEPPSFIGFIRDVTDLEEAEAQLVAAKEEAEAASRAKTDFLATVSHEIRTPMNAILGLTELALEGAATVEQRGLLETVFTNGQALLSLIDDILDVSKIEAGELRMSERPFAVADVAESVVEALGPRAFGKGVHLSLELGPGSPAPRVGDPDRIRQVLLNLVSNAVKFTSRGWVRVSVRRQEGGDPPAGADWIRIEVEDTGIGLSEEAQARVFENFFQADASTTRKFGGTGLGLGIARSVVEALGGEIQVRSELGEGATFTVRLPLLRGPRPFPKRRLSDRSYDEVRTFLLESPESPSGSERPASLANRESPEGPKPPDSPSLRALLAHMGNELEVHESLPDLLGAIEGHAAGPAVVCVDHAAGLPALDAVAAAILAHPGRARIQLCALVPPGPRSRWVHGRSLPTAYLTKPLTRRKLALPLARAAGQATAGPAGAGARESSDPGRSILVVEDNRPNQVFIERLLSIAGHVVDLANDGAEGFEMWKAGRYDLVLSDLEMPHVDGIQLTQLIREFEEAEGRRRTPVVAVTAHAVEGFRERCLEAGMDGYLTKPVSRDELLRVVREQEVPEEEVLLVEDDAAAALLAGRVIWALPGLRPLHLATGGDAVERVRAGGRWRLALVDLNLPDMGGHEVVREIRALDPSSVDEFWALTAHDVADVEAFCRSRGFAGVVRKPLRRERLVELLGLRQTPSTEDEPAGEEPRPAAVRVSPEIADLVPGYLERVRRRVGEADVSDREVTRVLGHNLKGTGSGYGFTELSRLGAELESTSVEGDDPTRRAVFERLVRYLDGVEWSGEG